MHFPICARKGCETVITVKKTVNQKYCGEDCQKIATNSRVMDRYYHNRDRKAGVKFYCTRCERPLSRYNEDPMCASCTAATKTDTTSSLLALFNGVTVS